MIDSLKKYEFNKYVGSISGFSFAIKNKSHEDTYFHPAKFMGLGNMERQ